MKFSNSLWRRRLVAAAATVLVAACGGSQVDPYHPARMVVFGDQTAAIEDSGLKYTVNWADSETEELDCTENPNWVQVMSNSYGFSFPQCHDEDQIPESKLYAANGAKVADIKKQIDTHLASDTLQEQDLVVLDAGMNDVLEQYALYAANPDAGTGALEDELEARGKALARQVVRISDTGAKVVVVRPYSMGDTPFARAEREAHEDEDEAADRPNREKVLLTLTERFNISLLVNIPDDGTRFATVDGLNTIDAMVDNPSNYSLENEEDPLCVATVVAPNCRTREADLEEININDGEFTTPYTWQRWLWADNLNLSPRGHERLGELAYNKATKNPF